MNFFLVTNNEKSLPKKIRKIFLVVGKTRKKKMSKNPIFQETKKKNCQGKKKMSKNPIFQEREKKCQKPLLKKNSKNFYS